MEKISKKYYKIYFLLFLISAVIFAGSLFNLPKQTEVFAEVEVGKINQTVSDDYYLSVGEVQNNLALINFYGESTELNNTSTYKPLDETFDTFYNSGEHSVKNYYYSNSNGKLTVNTPIIKNNSKLKVFTTKKPRTYYMPYIIQKNGVYQKNANGYFDYYLVTTKNDSWVKFGTYVPSFFDNSEVVAKVYVPKGSVGNDSDLSDGIISYNAALSLKQLNPSANYLLVDASERLFREYELLCDIMSQMSSYINEDKSDLNSDDFLDILSVALLDGASANQYTTGYSELLWPHQVSLHALSQNFTNKIGKKDTYIELFQKNGFSESNAKTIVEYLYNTPATTSGVTFNSINLCNYKITNINTKTNWNAFVENNSVFCHEFGHILGLPDLYNGSSDASAVGSWSQMCNNPSNNSFFTSYEREKLGWLNENNIVEVTASGVYTINAVSGLDGNSLIALKITDPTNSNRAIYIEYRSTTNQYYDSQCGNTGLIVYVTDSTYEDDGNQGAPPYELYVHRLSGKTVYEAGLNVGDVLEEIMYNVGQSSEFDSGVSVEIIYSSNMLITFKIKADHLPDYVYTVSDLNNNTLLYNKLIENLPSGKSNLTYECFNANTILNLDSIQLNDLFFLTNYMFDLSSIKFVNLADNLITFDAFDKVSEFILNNLSLQSVVLSGNLIDLSKLSVEFLDDQIFSWGIQYDKTNKLFYKNVSYKYYYKSTDQIEISCNQTKLNQCANGNIGTLTISTYGDFNIVEKFVSGNEFNFSKSYSNTVTVFNVSTKNNSVLNSYKHFIEDEFFDVVPLLDVEGIDKNKLSFSYTTPTSLSVGNKSLVVTIKNNNKTYATCVVYYYVYNTPVVEFNAGKYIEVIKKTAYTEQGITVYQDGVLVEYTQSNSAENCTYDIAYYLNGVLNYDGSYVLGTLQSDVNTDQKCTYLICYTLVNSYGKQFKFYNQITIASKILSKDYFETVVYNQLLKLSGSKLYADVFLENDILDLSNIGCTTIKGLDQLELKEDVTINLNKNNLSSIEEVCEYINQRNDSTIYLLFNNFKKQDILEISSTIRNNLVFGIQNFEIAILTSQESKEKVSDFYLDYQNYFNFDCGVAHIDELNNALYFLNYGQYFCKFTEKANGNIYQNNCSYIYIQNINLQQTKEYNEEYTLNLSSLISPKGIVLQSLQISSNLNKLNLSKLGDYELILSVRYLSKIVTTKHIISVVDTQSPILTLNGDSVVYVNGSSMYEQYFANDCTAHDDYDGVLSVTTIGEVLDEKGEYELTYKAQDSSGNLATMNRTVKVVSVDLASNNDIQNYGDYFAIPLKLYSYTYNDFTISYKLDTQSQYKQYDIINGVKFDVYGQINIDVKLVHKNNSDLEINLIYSPIIKDIELPNLTILGENKVLLYVGESYAEFGAKATDNCTSQTATLNTNGDLVIEVVYEYYENPNNKIKVESIDTTTEGTYCISYIAKDYSNNSVTKTREVEVSYYPITNLLIDNTEIESRYIQDSTITFNLTTISDYIVDPNAKIIWYINDQEYIVGTMNQKITFNEEGTYTVYAKLESNKQVVTDNIVIEIFKYPINPKVILIGIIVLAVIFVSFIIIFFINRYRKRNFY